MILSVTFSEVLILSFRRTTRRVSGFEFDVWRASISKPPANLSLGPVSEVAQQQQTRRPPARPVRDEYESSGADSEDEYVQERRPIQAKKRTKARKGGDGEDGGRRPAQRKRKRKQPVEVDLSELPPEQGWSHFMFWFNQCLI
jgi:transcription factor SPN1